ncbi:P-loop containing nucleoside triphosphate hydrolase protein [Stipitochalara longipes BDJ]|nr:P-loop containing nucleoside triphosphate hydrolase protein [Stipitochalara longipes BDJ]
MATNRLPEGINSILSTSASLNQRTVLLTCGISGSGKSTLALNIVARYPNFVRLSIDRYIFERYGVFGRDYGEGAYEGLQNEASEGVSRELERVLREGEKDVVLDLALWEREQRDGWREIIEREGSGRYQVVLVVFKGTEEVLWKRIKGREERWAEEGMSEGRPIGRELLAQFVRGFEWPDGEGEIVVDVV